MTMPAHRLAALALAFGTLGCLLLACVALARVGAARKGARTLANALDRRAVSIGGATTGRVVAPGDAAPGSPIGPPLHGESPTLALSRQGEAAASRPPATRSPLGAGLAAWRLRCGRAGARWLDTSLGRLIVASEDRRLLEQCGYVDTDARGFFLLSRLLVALAAPSLASWLWRDAIPGAYRIAFFVAMFTLGFMLPKWLLGQRAGARRRSVADEMPVLVDLLRLLQGVGLSLDQSLQIVVNDFRSMLPVLSGELALAQRQFAAGRSREQSLQRLGSSFDNEDLRAVVRLMIQVDRHGGAVQEPLKQFGDRLRETRRATLRERIGKLTVKMTGVMILTLLPALLIVTAGPGLLAIMRSLAAVHR
jgi:tight adherence protein C